jgi:hypothetical protein
MPRSRARRRRSLTNQFPLPIKVETPKPAHNTNDGPANADLDDDSPGDLLQEIGMLRMAIRRLIQLSEKDETVDYAIDVVEALSSASARLARMMVIQKTIAGGSSRIDKAIQQALKELVAEGKIQFKGRKRITHGN